MADAQETLLVVTKFRDESRKSFSKIRGNVKRLENSTQASFRRMTASARLFATRAAASIRSFVSGARAAVVGLAAVISAVLIGALLRIGKGFVDAASDFEESLSKFNIVFGNQAKDVLRFLEELGQRVNRGTPELIKFASSFQDLFVPLGFARDRAAELSKSIVELAIDVASFNNKLDTEVAIAFQSAIVGETEAVKKFGVVLTEAALNQELLAQGTGKTTRTATEQEKVLARIALLFRGSADAIGDAERTAEQFANTIKGLNSRINDLKVEFGEVLIRSILDTIKAFGGAERVIEGIRLLFAGITFVVNGLIQAFAIAADKILDFAEALGGANRIADALKAGVVSAGDAVKVLGALFERFKELASRLFGILRDELIQIAKDIAAEWVKAFRFALADIFDELGIFRARAERLRGVLAKSITDPAETFSAKWAAAFDLFRRGFLSDVFGVLGPGILAFEGLTKAAADAAETIAEVPRGGEGQRNAFVQGIQEAIDALDGLGGELRGLGAQLFSGTFDAFRTFFNELGDSANSFDEAFGNLARNFARNILDMIAQLLALRATMALLGLFGLTPLGGLAPFLGLSGGAGAGTAESTAATSRTPGTFGRGPSVFPSGGGATTVLVTQNNNISALDGRSVAEILSSGAPARALQDMLVTTLQGSRNSALTQTVRFA